MRSVRMFLAGRGGSFPANSGIPGFFLAALLLGSTLSLQAQSGRGTNGGAFTFASNKITVSESDGTAFIVVTRDSDVGKMLVDLVEKDGTATNGVDFKVNAVTNTLTFSNLQSAVSLPVPIVNNSKTNAAGQATATFTLANVRAAGDEDPSIVGTIGKANSTTLTILDDDRLLEFNIEKTWFSVPDPDPTNVATVSINVVLAQAPGDSSSDVSVDYKVFTDTLARPGSDFATAGADYDAVDQGTLTFGANDTSQTITITVTNDAQLEFNEDFHVLLTAAHGKMTQEAPSDGGTGGTTAGTTAGATDSGGTDSGGTDSGGGSTDLPYNLGPVKEATVTILYTGSDKQPRPAGSVDVLFNADNKPDTNPPFNQSPGANNTVYGVAPDASNNIVIVGDFTAVNAISRNRVARLLPSGQLDQTFNPVGGANDFVSGVTVYTNGTRSGQVIIVGGFTAVNGFQRNGVARLNMDGSIDGNFDPGIGANGPVYAVAVQTDGKILLGGDFTTFNGVPRNRVVRLDENGSVDLTFDPGLGADGPVYAILSQSSAPFSVKVDAPIGDPATFSRTIATTATNGLLSLSYNFFDSTNDITVVSGNTVLYRSGLVSQQVISTNIDGNPVTNSPPAVVPINFTAPDQTLRIVVNSTGTNASTNWTFTATIAPFNVVGSYIAGDFEAYNGVEHGRVAKLDNSGASDLAFNTATGLGADGPVRALGIQNGRLVLGGSFQSFNSFDSRGVAALNADGSFDRSFAVGSGTEDGDVFTMLVAGDQKIIIGGNFTFFNQTRRVFLARLLATGSLDTSFLDPAYNQYAGFPNPSGAWPSGSINSIALDVNTNVLVGGLFTQVGGGATRTDIRPRNNIARLVGGSTAGPGNLELLQPTFGGDENGGSLPVVLARANGGLGSGSIVMSTSDGAAISPLDYTGVTNVAIWPSNGPRPTTGSTNNIVQLIKVNDDTQIEGDENFGIRLTHPHSLLTLGGEYIPAGFALGDLQSGQGLIIDNDVPPSVFSFSSAQYTANENDTKATINVSRSGGTSSTVSVRYNTLSNTNAGFATQGVDYQKAEGVLTFTSGQTNRTFTVTLNDDPAVEQDEAVQLALSAPSPGAILGTNATSTLLIIDNDYAPGHIAFSSTNYDVTEGTTAVVTVQRTGGNAGVLRVDYGTVDGTAKVPGDYADTRGTLIWNDQDTAPRTILIPITDNGLVDGARRFSIILSNPSPVDALGSRTNATVTIEDNDALGAFGFNAAEFLADENGTNVVVNVVRRGGSAETATVAYATTNLTATAGVDYQAVSGTLTFQVGETSKSFIVPIIDNSIVNPERKIGLLLQNPQPAGASLGILSNATIAIIDNESVNIPAGSVETDFGTGNGANDAIQALALQADGKIVIGGDFTLVNRQVRTHLARLNADGTLDTTFGNDYNIFGSVRAVAVQTNGPVLIAGSFTNINAIPVHYLARISGGGILDNTFNTGSGADNPIFAVQETFITSGTNAARKILIGGSFSVFNGVARRGIARINEDGRTDLTFDPGSGVNGTVYAIALQRDGKILVGGEFSSVNGVSRINIARLNADGSLDTTFDGGLGADGSVRTIQLQADDKVLIGGLFTTVSSVGNQHVARLNTDGTLDATFNTGSGADGAVYAMAVQLDGKIIVAGDFTTFNNTPEGRITRLNPDGSIDPSINFGNGANAFIGAMAIQQDRKIVVGGGFTTFDDLPRNRFARVYGGSLSGAGALEFASANYTVNESGTNVVVTVRRTGGLLGSVSVGYYTQANTASAGLDYTDVSGTLVFGPGENSRTITIPVLNDNLAEPDELVDLVLTNATSGAILGKQPVASLTIVSDDSVISFSDLNYDVNESAPGGRAIIQIKREGSTALPVSVIFSASGGTASSGIDFTSVSTTVVIAAGQDTAVVQVPIIDDNQVEDNETINLRLSSPGQGGLLGRASATLTILDNDFAPGILSVVTPTPASENAGGIVITVQRNSGKTGAVSAKYTLVDGTASAGQDYVSSSGTLSFLEGVTSQSIFVPILDDKKVEGNEFFTILLSDPTGGAQIGTPSTQVLILDDDFGPASLDTSFNTSGGAGGSVNQIALQPDGKILVAGSFGSFGGTFANNIIRLNSNGSVDNDFSAGNGSDGTLYAIAPSPDGKIAVGGAFTNLGGSISQNVGRVSTNGLVDSDFLIGSQVNARVLAIAVQPDGKLVIGGDFTTPVPHIARINSDGSLDVSFNPDNGTDGSVKAIAIQPDGRILVGGSFTRIGGMNVRGIARLLPTGLLDSSFDVGPGVNGTVNAISLAPDGSIFIAGDFTTVNGAARPRIAELNANGTLNALFAPASGPNGVVNAILFYRGKLYAGGNFTSVANTPRKNLARFNADGSLDPDFDPGIGPDAPVNSIAAQSTGQILIAGNFSTVNGFSSPGIARLNGEAVNPNQQVRVTAVHAANGFVLLSFSSEIGQSYVIEGSTDLRTWQPLETKFAQGESTDFSAPSNSPYQFYRVRVNP